MMFNALPPFNRTFFATMIKALTLEYHGAEKQEYSHLKDT